MTKKTIVLLALCAGLGLAEAPVSAAAYETNKAERPPGTCCKGETVLGIKFRRGESGARFNKRLQREYSYEKAMRGNASFTRSAAKATLKETKRSIKIKIKLQKEEARRDAVYQKIKKLKDQ